MSEWEVENITEASSRKQDLWLNPLFMGEGIDMVAELIRNQMTSS